MTRFVLLALLAFISSAHAQPALVGPCMNNVSAGCSLTAPVIAGGTYTGGTFSGATWSGGTFSGNQLGPINLSDGSNHIGATALTFTTIAALTAFQPTSVGSNMVLATVSSASNAGDGAALTYTWVAASAAASNGIIIITPTGWVGNGRWIMDIPPGGVSVMAFPGVKCDGIQDDGARVNQILSQVSAAGAGTVFIPAGKSCYFGPSISSVFVPTGVVMAGTKFPQGRNYPAIALSTPEIIHDATTTFRVAGEARNLKVMETGLSVSGPSTMESFVSTMNTWNGETSVGITVAGDSATLDTVETIGFNKGVFSTGFAPVYIRDLQIDSANGLELTVAGDVVKIDRVSAGTLWSANLLGHFALAQATNVAGTGFTNGDVLTMAAAGVTCTTLPRVTVTVVAGNITATAITDVGDCTTQPANPKSFTGGTGTGATFTLGWLGANWRPGIAFYLHDKLDGVVANALNTGGYHTGISLSNIAFGSISNVSSEAGWANTDGSVVDATSTALLTTNCLVGIKMSNIYASGSGYGVQFNHRLTADGGSCLAGYGNDVVVAGLQVSTPGNLHNVATFSIGDFSQGIINGLHIGGLGFTSGASVVIGANERGWQINGVSLELATSPWYTIDSTSAPHVSITSLPTISSLNSGAALTVLCNTWVLANDTTAPTITLPATCPINQDVLVKDGGGQAGAHNITLSIPGGSTLDGAATQTMTTNFQSTRVRYNGLAAYLMQ